MQHGHVAKDEGKVGKEMGKKKGLKRKWTEKTIENEELEIHGASCIAVIFFIITFYS